MSRPRLRLPQVFGTAEIVPTMASVVAKFPSMHETMDQTVTPLTACFANTFEPWARVANKTDSETGMIQLLGYAAADKDTKDAVYEAHKLLSSAAEAWMGRSDIFILLKATADKDEKLDPESRHWVDSLGQLSLSQCGLLHVRNPRYIKSDDSGECYGKNS